MSDPKHKLERFLDRIRASRKILTSNKKKIMNFVKLRLAKGNAHDNKVSLSFISNEFKRMDKYI